MLKNKDKTFIYLIVKNVSIFYLYKKTPESLHIPKGIYRVRRKACPLGKGAFPWLVLTYNDKEFGVSERYLKNTDDFLVFEIKQTE